MSKLYELIKELCPNGVEYKTIEEVCEISRGIVMSKDFIRDNAGNYPVYSSQTSCAIHNSEPKSSNVRWRSW